MGVWEGLVEEQAYSYYRPQETGNKTDVRWLTLSTAEGSTIRVEGAQPLSVSATNFRPEDLDPGMTKKQQHWSDVIAREETVLCPTAGQLQVHGEGVQVQFYLHSHDE
jgi:beta-galactosidase